MSNTYIHALEMALEMEWLEASDLIPLAELESLAVKELPQSDISQALRILKGNKSP